MSKDVIVYVVLGQLGYVEETITQHKILYYSCRKISIKVSLPSLIRSFVNNLRFQLSLIECGCALHG